MMSTTTESTAEWVNRTENKPGTTTVLLDHSNASPAAWEGSTTATRQDIHTSTSAQTTIIVAIAAAVAVCLLVVVFCIYRRKRRSSIDEDRGKTNDLDNFKKSTRPMDGAQSSAPAMQDSGVREEDAEATSNVELQPRFSLSQDSVVNTNTLVSGYTVHNDTGPNYCKPERNNPNNRETVLFDTNTKSLRLKNDNLYAAPDKRRKNYGKDTNGNAKTASSETEVEVHRSEQEEQAISHHNKLQISAHYEYIFPLSDSAKSVEESVHQSRDNNDAGAEDVYITMGGINNNAYSDDRENEEEEMYANNIQIQRFQSLIETRRQTENSFPKRSASEVVKPPKPQPRPSKKKVLDPYDYLPKTSKSSTTSPKTTMEDQEHRNEGLEDTHEYDNSRTAHFSLGDKDENVYDHPWTDRRIIN